MRKGRGQRAEGSVVELLEGKTARNPFVEERALGFRGEQALVDERRHVAILIDVALEELDFEDARSGIVADRMNQARRHARALHVSSRAQPLENVSRCLSGRTWGLGLEARNGGCGAPRGIQGTS